MTSDQPHHGPVEQVAVVRAEAAERGQVVAALEDVDGVDLQHAEPVDEPGDLPQARLGGSRAPEALGPEGDASRERGTDGVDHDAPTLSGATDSHRRRREHAGPGMQAA